MSCFSHRYWKSHCFINIKSRAYYTDSYTERFKSHGFTRQKYRMEAISVNSYFHRSNCNRFKPVWYHSRKTRKGKYGFKHSRDWKLRTIEIRKWSDNEYGEDHRI